MLGSLFHPARNVAAVKRRLKLLGLTSRPKEDVEEEEDNKEPTPEPTPLPSARDLHAALAQV